MSLSLTAAQATMMGDVETYLQEAFTNGVIDDIGGPVVSGLARYSDPAMTANGAAQQVATKIAFKAVAAAVLKATNAGSSGAIVAGLGLTLTGSTLDVGAGSGISVDASNVNVKLAASNPNLAFDGSNGIYVTGVPSLFTVAGVAVSANVTAANLGTLTGGGSTTLHKHAGTGITNTPSGNLSSTDVQGALNELQGDIDTINTGGLDARYVNVTGDTMSGPLVINSGLTVDTNSLLVDTGTHTVNIGGPTPTSGVPINVLTNTASATPILIKNGSASGAGYVAVQNSAGGTLQLMGTGSSYTNFSGFSNYGLVRSSASLTGLVLMNGASGTGSVKIATTRVDGVTIDTRVTVDGATGMTTLANGLTVSATGAAITGDSSITGNATVTGNMTVDATDSVFFVDATNNQVGVGTTSVTSGKRMEVRNADTAATPKNLYLQNTSLGGTGIQLRNSGVVSGNEWQMFISNDATPKFKIGRSNLADYLTMLSGGATTLALSGSGTGLTVTGGNGAGDVGIQASSQTNTGGHAVFATGGDGGAGAGPAVAVRAVGGNGISGQSGNLGVQAIGGNGGGSSNAGASGLSATGGNGGVTNGAGGNGVTATGGTAQGSGTGGWGVDATGGTGNGGGVRGTGVGNGVGVKGQGAGTGAGGTFIGGTTGNGLTANGGATSGNGIVATGTGSGSGVSSTGGATDGNGGSFTGGGNGAGIFGAASGTGWGGQFTNGVRLDGRTLNTSNDGTVMSLDMTQTPGTITKNDANTRQFYGVKYKPTLNAGASNANTTFNLLDFDTTNTALTGLTTNLLKIAYGGSQKLLLTSAGDLTLAGALDLTAGPLKLNTATGTAKQVLRSGGAGLPTWGLIAPDNSSTVDQEDTTKLAPVDYVDKNMGPTILVFGASSISNTATDIRYLYPGFGVAAASANEIKMGVPSSRHAGSGGSIISNGTGMTMQELRVRCRVGSTGGSWQVTVRVNGVDSALTYTITAGTTSFNGDNEVYQSVVDTDDISVKIQNLTGLTAGPQDVTVSFMLTRYESQL
jgi:hypothetical protein